jgi:hypothetical protein
MFRGNLVDDDRGVAVVTEDEHLGAERAAHGMPAAQVVVDPDPHRNSRCSRVRPRRMKVGT